MSKVINISLPLLFGFLCFSSPAPAGGAKPPRIGTLDINSQEAGDGAGCFFFTEENAVRSYVFVDRDRLGWIRVNGDIMTLKPAARRGRWPWIKGETAHKVYSSDNTQAELTLEVISDCGQNLETCEVIYAGTLDLSIQGRDLAFNVKGHCAH